MTPDQTEVILEEYVAMNQPADEQAQTVDMSEMSTQDGKASIAPIERTPEDADFMKRMKAEMALKLGKPLSAQTQ